MIEARSSQVEGFHRLRRRSRRECTHSLRAETSQSRQLAYSHQRHCASMWLDRVGLSEGNFVCSPPACNTKRFIVADEHLASTLAWYDDLDD